jgi:acetyl esterase/lipase
MTLATEYRVDVDIPYIDMTVADEHQQKFCRLDLYRPENTKGFATVVYLHGGGLIFGWRELKENLKRRGFAVAGVGYRQNPVVRHPVYIEDAAAGLAWVYQNIASYGGDPEKIFLAGSSAGGYLALMLSLDKSYLGAHGIDANSLKGVIASMGHTLTHLTIRREQGKVPPENYPTLDHYAPLHHIRADAPPMICVTGDWDMDMAGRAQENHLLVALMKSIGHKDIEHHVITGLGHDDSSDRFWEPGLKLIERRCADVDRARLENIKA